MQQLYFLAPKIEQNSSQNEPDYNKKHAMPIESVSWTDETRIKQME